MSLDGIHFPWVYAPAQFYGSVSERFKMASTGGWTVPGSLVVNQNLTTHELLLDQTCYSTSR